MVIINFARLTSDISHLQIGIIMFSYAIYSFKVTVYRLLMNYSYETFFFCFWAGSLILAQISMMDYKSCLVGKNRSS